MQDDELVYRERRRAELASEGTNWVGFLLLAARMQPAYGDFGLMLELAAADLERCRAALDPFSAQAERFNDIPGVYRCNGDLEVWQDGNYRCPITVGDLRRARAALTAGKGSP